MANGSNGRTGKRRRANIRGEEPPLRGRLLMDESIPSVLEHKNPLIERMVETLRREGFLPTEDDDMWTRLCFDEALVNAIRHGNKYNARKQVRVRVSATPAKWNVLIEDEGRGFAEHDVPDPEDPASLLLERGRGIVMMRSYMSRVTHFRRGAALLLEKFQKPGPVARGRAGRRTSKSRGKR